MHPDPAFAWKDEAAMRHFVGQVAFAHLFAAGPEGAAVVHVPVLVADAGLRFHIARRNRIVPLIGQAGAVVIASIAAPDGYVSPAWYASVDQVPTWNYVAVEAEGAVRTLDNVDLIALLDGLSGVHEARVRGTPPWTRAKMAPGRFDAMLPAIVGYELRVDRWRGTRKLSQNKNGADSAGVVAGMEINGRTEMAALVAAARAEGR